ncbi:MAG: hypothetical protein GY861_21130 [bacterium]|nr:hypothetical protein [bacterium]
MLISIDIMSFCLYKTCLLLLCVIALSSCNNDITSTVGNSDDIRSTLTRTEEITPLGNLFPGDYFYSNDYICDIYGNPIYDLGPGCYQWVEDGNNNWRITITLDSSDNVVWEKTELKKHPDSVCWEKLENQKRCKKDEK